MNKQTAILLQFFNKKVDNNCAVSFRKYIEFNFILDEIISGEGPIGDGYLIIWDKDVLEKRNDDYMVTEFLNNVMLIGSDGGGIAFGINNRRHYIAVPFIGMSDDNVVFLSDCFDGFIERIAKSNY